MPDVTAIALEQSIWGESDFPLIPSTEEVLEYAQMLDYQGKYLDLDFALTEIKRNLLGFVRVGLCAWKVQTMHLYKQSYAKFKDWCSEAVGLSYWQVKRFIEAARVVLDLARAGFERLPTCEAQARPLGKFFGQELADKWQEVIEAMPPDRQSAIAIEAIVNPETNKPHESIKLKKETAQRLRERALERGLSIDELLDELLEDGNITEEVEKEKLANWQTDLEDLVGEHENEKTEQPKTDRTGQPSTLLSCGRLQKQRDSPRQRDSESSIECELHYIFTPIVKKSYCPEDS